MTYLQITLKIDAQNRSAAAGIYQKYKGPYPRYDPGLQVERTACP